MRKRADDRPQESGGDVPPEPPRVQIRPRIARLPHSWHPRFIPDRRRFADGQTAQSPLASQRYFPSLSNHPTRPVTNGSAQNRFEEAFPLTGIQYDDPRSWVERRQIHKFRHTPRPTPKDYRYDRSVSEQAQQPRLHRSPRETELEVRHNNLNFWNEIKGPRKQVIITSKKKLTIKS